LKNRDKKFTGKVKIADIFLVLWWPFPEENSFKNRKRLARRKILKLGQK